jgi:hypothetical protein
VHDASQCVRYALQQVGGDEARGMVRQIHRDDARFTTLTKIRIYPGEIV